MRRATWLVIGLALVSGCVDKAKADYDRCIDRDRNYDAKGAAAACSAAVAADPNSPSGQSAAKKLQELQAVEDKIKAEAADKAARDAKIQKDEVLVVQSSATVAPMGSAPPGASAVAVAGSDTLAQAQALYAAGDLAGAHKLLEEKMADGSEKPSKDELKLLGDVCKAQKDKRCLSLLKKVR